MDPQDGKSCLREVLKIFNASTLCEFIKTVKCNDKSACDESDDHERFNRINVVSPQRNVKKSRPYSAPSTSKQSKDTEVVISRENCSLPPANRPLIFNCSEPLLSTVSTRTETNFPLNVLLEDTGASVLGPSWKYCQEIFAP